MPTPSNALNISSAGLVKFDGTATFSAVTTTNHNLIIGAASNGLTSVAPSATSGIAVISQGASADPTFGIVVPAGGGTGVNNGSSTLTLGGNLTTSGAFASTFTMTGVTNVTFPTSGTLSTTTGTITSVSGTANRITSTGGTTPVIDISASYVGQSSITTLGTISTGTWNGTVLTGQYGGTGVANTGKTITLGGSLTTSGAFDSTFTMTGSTSVTFPTSGTLATTAGIPSFPLSLANGGTNANLTASNGGIFYSTASAGAILSGTSTALQMLQSGASTTPAWSTSTWPATTSVNQVLYSSSANVVAGLATANNAVLATNGSGVPSITATPSVTSISFDTGTNNLSRFSAVAAYTPSIAFGGASVGITYSTQTGAFARIGPVVFFMINITLSSKGSSTGAATVSLPVTGATSGRVPIETANLTFTGQCVALNINGASANIDGFAQGGAAATNLADTSFSNTTQLTGYGFYFSAQ